MTPSVSDEILTASKKRSLEDDCLKAHPPESPLNGGMNSTIPLLGGVPLLRRGGCLYLFVSSFFTRSILFKIFFHATCVAPDKDGNVFPLTNASPTKGEGKFPTYQKKKDDT